MFAVCRSVSHAAFARGMRNISFSVTGKSDYGTADAYVHMSIDDRWHGPLYARPKLGTHIEDLADVRRVERVQGTGGAIHRPHHSIAVAIRGDHRLRAGERDRKSTRLNSSHANIS